MTTTYRKKMNTTWLLGWPLVLAIGLWSANASAWCDPQLDENEFRNCYPNNPPGNSWHSYAAYIGSDPNNDYTQWIGWFDLTTGQCDGWDMIGGLAGSGGLDRNTRVFGLNGNDYLTTIPPSSMDICGYPMEPPVGNGYAIYFMAGDWDGGVDELIDYTTLGGGMTGSADGTTFETWGPSGNITGGGWHDVLWKWGSPGLTMFMGEGNDRVNIMSSTWHSGSCGGGSDFWCGPGLASNCEQVLATCN